MAEIFPAGFIGLKDCISRETDLRFGAGSAEDPGNRQSIFEEMCLRLYAEPWRHWAVAFMPNGKRVDIPVDVWMRPEAERREIASTGEIAYFWNATDYTRHYAGRVALLTSFTLVPVPVKQETEFEKVVRLAKAQLAGRSLGSVPGLPPCLPIPQTLKGGRTAALGCGTGKLSPSQVAERLPVIDVPVDQPTSAAVKRPAPHIQKKQVEKFLSEYAATLNGGPKPTEDELRTLAKDAIGYLPAEKSFSAILTASYPQLKREPGDRSFPSRKSR